MTKKKVTKKSITPTYTTPDKETVQEYRRMMSQCGIDITPVIEKYGVEQEKMLSMIVAEEDEEFEMSALLSFGDYYAWAELEEAKKEREFPICLEDYAPPHLDIPKDKVDQFLGLGNVRGCMLLFLIHMRGVMQYRDALQEWYDRDQQSLSWDTVGQFLRDYAGTDITQWDVRAGSVLQDLNEHGYFEKYQNDVDGIDLLLKEDTYAVVDGNSPAIHLPFLPPFRGFSEGLTYQLMFHVASSDWLLDGPLLLGTTQQINETFSIVDTRDYWPSESYKRKRDILDPVMRAVKELDSFSADIGLELYPHDKGWYIKGSLKSF